MERLAKLMQVTGTVGTRSGDEACEVVVVHAEEDLEEARVKGGAMGRK